MRFGAAAPNVNSVTGADAASSETGPIRAAPFLQLGNWLINPSGVSFGRASCVSNFGLASLDLQQDKSQGRQGTGEVRSPSRAARRRSLLTSEINLSPKFIMGSW